MALQMTYFLRVGSKDTTYAKQLREYEDAVIAKRFSELNDQEVCGAAYVDCLYQLSHQNYIASLPPIFLSTSKRSVISIAHPGGRADG
jgi:hypothetical protein